MIFSFLLFF
jgi:hypothetical protein